MKIGLIRGRHDLPVNEYIFDEIKDVFAFDEMRQVCSDFINKKEASIDFNEDNPLHLEVIVTGLTVATVCLLQEVNSRAYINLTLYHYDITSGEYIAQKVNISQWP